MNILYKAIDTLDGERSYFYFDESGGGNVFTYNCAPQEFIIAQIKRDRNTFLIDADSWSYRQTCMLDPVLVAEWE